MNFFRRFRDAFLCAALLGIPFFFLNANLKDPAKTNVLDRLVLKASAPIQYVATQVASGVSSVIEEYVYLVDVKAENERLASENARLREEIRKLREEAQENRRLRAQLGLRDTVRGESLSAQVIGKEVSPFFRVVRIRLDRGEHDQVRAGMPVVSTQGLVGQVRRSWDQYSDVLLTVDRTSAIDVIVTEPQADRDAPARVTSRGILRGTGDSDRYLCRIQYLQRADEVEVGDEVYTSGLGARFPASILVGTVSRVLRQDFGLYQTVEVTPSVSFGSVEEVLVLTQGSREHTALDATALEGEELEL